MSQILSVQTNGITEYCRRLFEGDTVPFIVGNGLADVPREHNTVYTLIRLLGARALRAVKLFQRCVERRGGEDGVKL